MKILIVASILVMSLAALPAQAQGPEEGPPPDLIPSALAASIAGADALPNLSSGLSQLYVGWQNGKPMEELAQAAGAAELSGERVKVMLIMLNEAAAQNAIAALPALGAEVIVSFQTWIDAWVPIAALPDIAALPGISLVREPMRVFPIDTAPSAVPPAGSLPGQESLGPAAGPVQTQGVLASGADIWHAAGWRGQGVKVALIDTFARYQEAVAMGELPNNISIYSPAYSPINTDNTANNHHGTACAEIIYDMAPGVQFTFATPNTAVAMARLIVDLAQQGNKIISSSFGWVGYEPGDGTGPLNDAIRWAYEQKGTLYVQAAGNMRRFHWDGGFSDPNKDYWHEFTPGYVINWFDADLSQTGLQELEVGWKLSIYLRWNSWPKTTDDFDLYLVRYDPSTGQSVTVASSKNRQTGAQPPTEELSYPVVQKGWYGIAVQQWYARSNAVLDLGGYGLPPFSINQPARSLIDAARSPYAFSVAAVDVGTFQQEVYSSEGPTHGPGGALTGGGLKPNISGFANVSTWVFGNFYGTSSATPHVAGAAALVLGAYPGSHAYNLWVHLAAYAADRGPAGFDSQYGGGVLRMMTPAPASGGGSQTPPGQCPGCAPQVGYKLYLPSLAR